MPRLTIVFGVLLVLLGIGCFVGTGSAHPTSLIPSSFGLVLAFLGFLADRDAAKRGMWMHIAVTVGLLGFLATAGALFQTMQIARGVSYPRPVAIEERAAMSIVCLLFVLFCVRSFIAARRARLA